ncbi:hypothetical protein DYB32_003130 [Aphanomyces invadans]|uniref:Uncharacterized protein n=1 Tax=Aphanomyces invadans TaxID=157072 RepID=A0A3R6ZSW2_9STRA|nr:hypothetical protein DYB32_003130 [Aphanomyces invadans]
MFMIIPCIVFHGDDVWLRLDDFCPDLPTKRDPITTYVKEVQHYVSWGERANGLTGQTSCLANVLETLVPSIAHYGYDTSMAECLGEIHAAMHLAKWTIEAVGSSTQGDENDDVYDRGSPCYGNIVVKASVNLVESHQRATTFLGTKNDIVTDQIETHQASRTHLAMIHDAKETHAVEYFTHKFKTAAMARQR